MLNTENKLEFNVRGIIERSVFEGIVFGYESAVENEEARKDPATFINMLTEAVMGHLELVINLPMQEEVK